MANTARMYTVNEAASRLGVRPRSVRHYIKRGFFPNVERVSPETKSPYRIPESDIIEFEKKRRRV